MVTLSYINRVHEAEIDGTQAFRSSVNYIIQIKMCTLDKTT